MKLKLLAALSVVVLSTSGCVVHFPLSDNQPSLMSQDDSESISETSTMSTLPTAPNTTDPVKGNVADTPPPPR